MCDRNLVVCLLIHEDVVVALFVKILVWAALHAYVFKFLTDVEPALKHTSVDNVLQFHAHECVSLSGLHVQEFDDEEQLAVHADAGSVLNVL